jgi:creatinine amidohydrolase
LFQWFALYDPSMSFKGRAHVLHEMNLAQARELKPNLAVLPWGATEAHNYHLPHGTDVIEATRTGEAAVERANELGARCVLLPCVPFGNNNSQLDQVATITMRTSTQQLVLRDVADSLVRQGIDRLVILNFHGGNEFKPLIRDVMLDVPGIFIVQINAFAVVPRARELLTDKSGDHADEFETSLMLYLAPELVAPLETAGDGSTTPSKIAALTVTPGVWAPRDWAALTKDTGTGNPKAATAEKGRQISEMIVAAIVPDLIQLSTAKRGDFPFVLPE